MGIELWTKSEEFAFKKNHAENSKLQEKLVTLAIDNQLKKEEIDTDIRSLKHLMREIKASTGHSLEEIRTISAKTTISDLTSVSYTIPSKLKGTYSSKKSGNLKGSSLFHELNNVLKRNENPASSIKPRAISTDGNLARLNGRKDPRKVKSEAGSLGFALNRENTTFSTDEDLYSCVFYEEDENESEDEAEAEERRYYQRIYNPWNIQSRHGANYDALELPVIRDCYRPLCRPNCSTCLMRKNKGPCFVVPGLVSVAPNPHASSGSGKGTQKKKEKMKTKKKYRKLDREKSKMTESLLCDVNENELHKKNKIPGFLNGRMDRGKKISQARLEELSAPRGGLDRPMRFSKAFLKRRVRELKQKNMNEELSEIEKENRRKIESRVSRFLAYLNKQYKPEKMVDLPIRDDIMKTDSLNLNPIIISNRANVVALPSIRRKVVKFR